MELQWPLILFTTLLAWSAGLFAAQGVYALRKQGAAAQMPALIASVVLLVAGGIAVFFHLEHWERIFNGFGHITSGITQELIAIVVMFIVMVLFFVYLRRSGERAEVPAWVAVLAIISAAALVFVMAHSYMMAARPAWSTFLWVCVVLGNALVLGPATFAAISSAKGVSNDLDSPLVLGGAVLNAVCSGAYLGYLAGVGANFMQVEYYYDLTHPTKGIESFVSPIAADPVLVWLGVAVIGLLCPIVAAVLGRKQTNWKIWGCVAALCAIIGAICIRVVFYNAGASVFMFY